MGRVPLVEETPCNLCGARDYDVVSERDRDGRPLRTTICRRCGLVWTNPRPTLQALNEYYREHYRQDYKHMPVPTARKLLRGMSGALERRRWLEPSLRPGSRILDVGCGAGELVYVLRAAGFDARGLEPDERYARYAGETLGVPVEVSPVGEVLPAGAPFDVITLFHALEHVGDPVATIASLAAALQPSGLLVIEVPNVEAVCQAPGHRFHYAHLFSFSQGTLAALAARAGLSCVRMELSADGGNILAVFRRANPAPTPPSREPREQYEHTVHVLRAHTALRHYLSFAPYARLAGRLAQRRREGRLLRRLRTTDDILRWARTGALDRP
jgi:2-polyprenyl-3-methyl-5-hydroxy-6-metoxy-1,4-benzoquinol methylase